MSSRRKQYDGRQELLVARYPTAIMVRYIPHRAHAEIMEQLTLQFYPKALFFLLFFCSFFCFVMNRRVSYMLLTPGSEERLKRLL